MALVTFTDSKGVVWSVWDVARPLAEKASMDYLAHGEYRNGWLCFQTADMEERRRLAEFPDNWFTMNAEQLERLLAAATVVTTRPSAAVRAIDSPRTETGGYPPFNTKENPTA